jgi:ficolin
LGTSSSLPGRSCLEIHRTTKQLNSAVYWIKPSGQTAFQAYCDMEDKDLSGNAGWLVIQRRDNNDPNQDFWNTFDMYKAGFGNQWKSFYLGNTKISQLTNDLANTLRVDMVYKGGNYKAEYGTFRLGPESETFTLYVGSYLSGDVPGDSFSFHNSNKFSTHDRDSDSHPSNCATWFKGAWWYSSCHSSNCKPLFLPIFLYTNQYFII